MQKKGHRVRLGENVLLFLWQALSHSETTMFVVNVCALMTQEIVRSKNAPCSTKESPYNGQRVSSSPEPPIHLVSGKTVTMTFKKTG